MPPYVIAAAALLCFSSSRNKVSNAIASDLPLQTEEQRTIRIRDGIRVCNSAVRSPEHSGKILEDN